MTDKANPRIVTSGQLVRIDQQINNPEVNAMLQALYSRSPKSVLEHVKDIKEGGASKFMGKWYIGYGHKSIGDCGTITIYFENVSLLAAKAIQDHPLYNGQEASTRYLDMSTRPCVCPAMISDGHILDRSMRFYQNILAMLKNGIRRIDTKPDGMGDAEWSKAISVKAFDIARGFLPAGVSTFVSFHGTLSTVRAHLSDLTFSPLGEVASLARSALDALRAEMPSSFKDRKSDHHNYRHEVSEVCSFDTDQALDDTGIYHEFDQAMLDRYRVVIDNRPPMVELHQRLRYIGNVTWKVMLDFGSWRDLQRHRSCLQNNPLLTMNIGFHPWYLAQVDRYILDDAYTVRDALAVLGDFSEEIRGIDCTEIDRQYFIPIGYVVKSHLVMPVPSAVYVSEIRSQSTVHPTLRSEAIELGCYLNNHGIRIHLPEGIGSDYARRARQDIVEVAKA